MALIVFGFLLLTLLVHLFPLSVVDREFSEEVQEHRNPVLDSIMRIISFFGIMPFSLIMVLSVAAIFLFLQRRREALFIMLTLSSGIVSSVVKILVNRPRPGNDLVRIVEKANHQSFPSGHTLFYVVFFGFLTLLMYHLKDRIPRWIRKSVSFCALFLIFTIPVSRIYLGAHWFTDVLGGFLLGLMCLFALSYFYLEQHKRPSGR